MILRPPSLETDFNLGLDLSAFFFAVQSTLFAIPGTIVARRALPEEEFIFVRLAFSNTEGLVRFDKEEFVSLDHLISGTRVVESRFLE